MNKRDFGKYLSEFYDSLSKEVNSLKSEITEAKQLKKKLESYFDKCQDIINKISINDAEIRNKHALIEVIKAEIDSVKIDADEKLQSINTSLTSVQSNIEEMETAYKSFVEINNKIVNEETGLVALLTLATNLQNRINEARVDADKKLQSINTSLTSVQSNIEEMETAYKSFTEINKEIDDEKTGLKAILESSGTIKTDIIAIKSETDILYKEIRKFRDNASSYTDEIGKLKSTASSTVNKIQTEFKESTELKSKIREIFEIGSRGAHSNHFLERRNLLYRLSISWLVFFLLLLVATVILAIYYVLPLAENLKDPVTNFGIEVFLIRFSIITPTLFGAIYALSQFSNDRRLYEKYAFKVITISSAETAISTLSRSLEKLKDDDKDIKIIDFAINIFSNMYQEPVEPIHDKWTIKGGNKLLNITAELTQIRKDVDKLVDNKTSSL